LQGVIDELGLRGPASWRAACATTAPNVVGVLVSDIEPFSAELIKGAARALRGTGYELIVYSRRQEPRPGRLGEPAP
jgi:LacI family transcriptional regulator